MRLKIKTSVGVALFCFIIFNSCKHKTDFNSLTEVSYTNNIAPIISSNCSASGCHGSIAFQKFNLNTYDGLMNGGITAGSPEKSKLYKVLKTLNKEDIMPKEPFNELSEKQIQLIYVWIGQGAKNN